jgi:methylmalonyl-CoA/ethylmalonyl-CoA epimerase
MINGIDHIAIAVENIEEAIELFEKTLGLKLTNREAVAGYDVETATFAVGATAIELVEGKTGDSPIRKFVESRGPGIHHIAFAVGDLAEAISTVKTRGLRLVDETPKPGKQGSRVAFIHPKSTHNILFELVEPAKND